MRSSDLHYGRRAFMGSLAASTVLFTTRVAFAEQLAATPSRTEGPFYPTHLPLDRDNDLILIKDGITPAVGEITQLTGRELDVNGNPLKGRGRGPIARLFAVTSQHRPL